MSDITQLINTNISGAEDLISPREIKKMLPESPESVACTQNGRQVIQNILDDKDHRIFMVVGPCSVHDPKAAMEYAVKLKKLAERVADKIVIVMRVYFEKPRTTIGWKGLINDPYMDDSFHIEEGLKIARKLLLDITGLGLPASTEALDPISPQYVSEFISWAAIGARTTESQTHREMASGLSMPVGFKNGTDGGIQVAIDAMLSSLRPHHFLGINHEGRICKFSTKGNAYSHIVLRGGGGHTNYDKTSIATTEAMLEKNGLRKKIVVDCSHANSNKDHNLQPNVLKDCIDQIQNGNKSICGFMIESNLFAGNQSIPKDLGQLKYGVSVTDKCVDWETTEKMIMEAYDRLGK